MADELWLRTAKRLAVGQTERFRCCGRTAAAVIRNEPDKWSCSCYRCKSYHVERKQYAQLVAPEVLGRELPAPQDLKRLSELDAGLQQFLYGFLISKGIWPDMAGDVYYSEQYKRLVWKLSTVSYIARALHEYQQPKWVVMGKPMQYAAATNTTGSLIVLTEDYLSALKIQQVTERYSSLQVTAVALLGTRMSTALRSQIILSKLPVLCMLDGDSAGYAGTSKLLKELKPFTKVDTFSLEGKDPKDMTCAEMLGGVNEFYKRINIL